MDSTATASSSDRPTKRQRGGGDGDDGEEGPAPPSWAAGILEEAGLRKGADAHGGAGLFAAKHLPEGFTIRVPRRYVLDASAASRTTLGARLTAEGFSAEDVLLAVLADARRSGAEGGAYSHWAATLPAAAPDAASWPSDAQALLKGTDLGAALPHVEQELAELHGRLAAAAGGAAAITLDELRWARGMALSRRFPARLGGGEADEDAQEQEGRWGTIGSLVPVMDLLNHSAAADPALITLGTTEDGQHAFIRNTAPLAAGDEAFTNYGSDKSNEELLASFGFAVPNNPADRIMLLLSLAGEEVACAIGRGGAIPIGLWKILAGDMSQGEEDEGDEHGVPVAQLRLWITAGTVSQLRAALGAKLKAVFEGETPAAGPLASRGRSVAHYRAGLQQVLLQALDEIDRLERAVVAAPDAEGGDSSDSSDSSGSSEEDEDDDASGSSGSGSDG